MYFMCWKQFSVLLRECFYKYFFEEECCIRNYFGMKRYW